MLIHNHAHELEDDARILRGLVAATSPSELMLGADIGWVVHGGWDPARFVTEFGARLAYLHVRDVVQIDGEDGFTEVGRGEMDWTAFAEALRRVNYRGWLTAESEFSDRWHGYADPGKTAAAQYAGMTKVFGEG